MGYCGAQKEASTTGVSGRKFVTGLDPDRERTMLPRSVTELIANLEERENRDDSRRPEALVQPGAVPHGRLRVGLPESFFSLALVSFVVALFLGRAWTEQGYSQKSRYGADSDLAALICVAMLLLGVAALIWRSVTRWSTGANPENRDPQRMSVLGKVVRGLERLEESPGLVKVFGPDLVARFSHSGIVMAEIDEDRIQALPVEKIREVQLDVRESVREVTNTQTVGGASGLAFMFPRAFFGRGEEGIMRAAMYSGSVGARPTRSETRRDVTRSYFVDVYTSLASAPCISIPFGDDELAAKSVYGLLKAGIT